MSSTVSSHNSSASRFKFIQNTWVKWFIHSKLICAISKTGHSCLRNLWKSTRTRLQQVTNAQSVVYFSPKSCPAWASGWLVSQIKKCLELMSGASWCRHLDSEWIMLMSLEVSLDPFLPTTITTERCQKRLRTRIWFSDLSWPDRSSWREASEVDD